MKYCWNTPRCRSSCLLTLVIAVAGCSPNQLASKEKKSARTIPVKTVSVTKTDVQRRTQQPATVHAFFEAEIRAKVSGFVKEIKADMGDYVEAGAVLATIDVPEMQKKQQVIRARIRRLEAEEMRARAGIELAAARVRSSQALLEESKSQVNRLDASVASAESTFNRTQDLVQRGSLQSRMLDEARLNRDSELANKEAVRSAVKSSEAKVAVAKAQEASAKADSDAAKAETEIARRQVEEMDVLIVYATVKAPFAGVVTERNIDPGDLVRELSEVGSGEPLFVISQVDKVRVRIPVPESYAPLVNRGDGVVLTFPSFAAEAPITATVTRRSGSLDPATRTMMVEADIDNADRKLLPGMFGQASIDLATKVAANMLPAQAIRFGEGGKAYVYVVGEDQTVAIADVTTGLDDGNSIEVLSGVQSGQRVIGSHLKRFTDGQKVAVLATE